MCASWFDDSDSEEQEYLDGPLWYEYKRTPARRTDEDTITAIEQFLESSDIDEKDCDGETHLTIAVKEGRTHVVRWLVKVGAALEGDIVGRCSLMYNAINGRHPAMVEYLLSAGVSATQDETGMSPLFYATRILDEDTALLLVKAGADPEAPDLFPTGESAVQFAERYGNDALARALRTARENYLSTPWNRREPAALGRSAQSTIIATLAAAKAAGLHLPVEMWQHVFGFMDRRDFAERPN